MTAVTAASGASPSPSITYSANTTTTALPGSLTGVTFGSADTDTFNYDPNTGRTTGYTFSVNSVTDTGTLTWNANGSLSTLKITDLLTGSADTQTCNYIYDDLGRLAGNNSGYSVNCGSSGWRQLFTFDAFGNIAKSGSLTFAPTYSTKNQYTLSGVNVQYDLNGNLLTDNLNTYTWDPNFSNVASVNGIKLIYDALGRMVEQQNGSIYTQILYSPAGKTALMNGQTLAKAFIHLPGGGTAIYNPAGLAYYRHPDWLGSSRLTSTEARAPYSISAYAPFGEQYDVSGASDPSFTGQNSDTLTSLYDFLYRENSPSQGRWISPDPSGLSAVDPSNPQTWNRYAYVGGDPMSRTDPNGLIYYGGHHFSLTPTQITCSSGSGPCPNSSTCTLDGAPTPCTMVGSLLQNGGAAACPNNICTGVSNGQFVLFIAGGGGARGYVNFGDIAKGLNEVNGQFLTDSEYQDYLRATYAPEIAGQYRRLSANLSAVFGGAVSADPDDPDIVGGHANFTLDCGAGPCPSVGRYDDGIHIECATGGCGPGDPLVVHDDTISPWTGDFTFGAVLTGNFWEHGFVDLVGGTICNCVFPQ